MYRVHTLTDSFRESSLALRHIRGQVCGRNDENEMSGRECMAMYSSDDPSAGSPSGSPRYQPPVCGGNLTTDSLAPSGGLTSLPRRAHKSRQSALLER